MRPTFLPALPRIFGEWMNVPVQNEQLRGLAVSPGVAVASAYCVHAIPPMPLTDRLDQAHAITELAVLEETLRITIVELQDLQEKVQTHVGEEEAAIFGAQLSILRDETLFGKVRRQISEQCVSASTAVHAVLVEYQELFRAVTDDYLRERFADLRDVLQRVAGHLATTESHFTTAPTGPMILVANELLPSDVVAVSEEQVVGIITQCGGRTSHAAILARSYGIPSVAGVESLLSRISTGDTVVVDGSAGRVIVNPGEEALRAYRKLQREYVQLKATLAVKSLGPARTKDGQRVFLMANISCAADAAQSVRVGADGIGLHRTEFFFLTHPGMPTEDEQVRAYKEIIEASPEGPVTIRTLDLGGDKTIPFLTHAPEANPFMGWRSIRLSFEHPEIFLTQIRAVLRAAHDTEKQIHLLFPMITIWEELERIHAFVAKAKEQLSHDTNQFGEVQIGMMLEVPAAEVMLDQLVELVDFVSLGSNDLVQYLTAADRDNPKVSHLCQALSPAVLYVLQRAVLTCKTYGKPLTICGETAGSPRAFPLLLGMGLRSFSMSPSFIPVIHNLAAHITIAESEEILAAVMQLKTAAEIQTATDAFVLRICPQLAPLLIA